jgi:hypothetical protein
MRTLPLQELAKRASFQHHREPKLGVIQDTSGIDERVNNRKAFASFMVTRSVTMNTKNVAAAGAGSSDNEGNNDATFMGDDRNARYHRATDHDIHKDAIMLATAALAHTIGPQQQQQQEQEQQDQSRSPQAAAVSIGLQQREEHRSSDEEYYEGSPGPPQESLLVTPHAFRTDSYNNNNKTVRGVPHIYHDYSQVPDVDTYVRKKTGGVTQPFPEKLHAMLHDIENNDEYQRIVQWLPHGRAFIVRNPKEFTEIIMPKYVIGWANYGLFNSCLLAFRCC